MKELICICCPKGCHLHVDEEKDYAVTGNSCPRGAQYGKSELLHPVRTITSTVAIRGAALPRLPVKTDRPLPKEKMMDCMALLKKVTVQAPITVGTVVLPCILGTDVNIVAAKNL